MHRVGDALDLTVCGTITDNRSGASGGSRRAGCSCSRRTTPKRNHRFETARTQAAEAMATAFANQPRSVKAPRTVRSTSSARTGDARKAAGRWIQRRFGSSRSVNRRWRRDADDRRCHEGATSAAHHRNPASRSRSSPRSRRPLRAAQRRRRTEATSGVTTTERVLRPGRTVVSGDVCSASRPSPSPWSVRSSAPPPSRRRTPTARTPSSPMAVMDRCPVDTGPTEHQLDLLRRRHDDHEIRCDAPGSFGPIDPPVREIAGTNEDRLADSIDPERDPVRVGFDVGDFDRSGRRGPGEQGGQIGRLRRNRTGESGALGFVTVDHLCGGTRCQSAARRRRPRRRRAPVVNHSTPRSSH